MTDNAREGEAGRRQRGAAASPLFFYSLICLENRTFNSAGIPGPAAATSYLLEDSDNPTGCTWEGRGQEDFFRGTCPSVPSIASNGSAQHQSQNQCAKTPEKKVFARGFGAGGTSVFI